MSDLNLDAIKALMTQPAMGHTAHVYQREALAGYVPALIDEVERLRAETGSTYCAYCGAVFSVDAPDATQAVGDHIETCEHHPMHALRLEVERLREREQQLVECCQSSEKNLAIQLGTVADLTERIAALERAIASLRAAAKAPTTEAALEHIARAIKLVGEAQAYAEPTPVVGQQPIEAIGFKGTAGKVRRDGLPRGLTTGCDRAIANLEKLRERFRAAPTTAGERALALRRRSGARETNGKKPVRRSA